MSVEKTYHQVLEDEFNALAKSNGWKVGKKAIPHGVQLSFSWGVTKAFVDIFENGRTKLGGGDSKIKTKLAEVITSLESPSVFGEPRFSCQINEIISETKAAVPNLDPTIERFLKEAARCCDADAYLGTAFLVGAASEKAIWILVDEFIASLPEEDAKKCKKILGNHQSIKEAFKHLEEWLAKYKKNENVKNALFGRSQSSIESAFSFFRQIRNEVGHPEVPPPLDKARVQANIACFGKYLEGVYWFIDFFQKNQMKLYL